MSVELMLEPINCGNLDAIGWIICGGETQAGARYMEPEWARDLRDQCASAGVPFFLKQMTGKRPIPDDLLVRKFPRARAPAAAA